MDHPYDGCPSCERIHNHMACSECLSVRLIAAARGSEMGNKDEVTVIRIANPADLVESLTGVRPHSGTCMFCKKALTATDIDHSVCNSCWQDTFKHTWEDYDGDCNICDETWDDPIHIRNENHVHNFEPLDETKVILDRYCPFCGYREVL